MKRIGKFTVEFENKPAIISSGCIVGKKESEGPLKKDFDEEYSSKNVGESWELWSLYGGSSVVQNGFLAGNTLDELMEIYLGDLVGENVFSFYKGDFPLLVKITQPIRNNQ